MDITAQIDFAQPLIPHSPRLQGAWGRPERTLQARDAAQLAQVLQEVEQAARQGAWCVGGLTYEAASALRADLPTQVASGPLAWFAVYGTPPTESSEAVAPWQGRLHWQDGMAQADFAATLAQIHRSGPVLPAQPDPAAAR